MVAAVLKLGIIGYGLAGAVFHAPLIEADSRLSLAAIATSRSPPFGKSVRIHADPLALIADPALDAIVIASPNQTHFPLAQAALRAGKHVVVDKPFSVTVAEADALIALAAECERLVVPFHNRRWDGDFLTVRQLLDQGGLGEIMLFEAHWDRFRPAIKQGWKEVPGEGTGLLSDLGPHMIDQMLLLFGWPDAIRADVLSQRPAGRVDDYFDLLFAYGSRRVRLACSTLVSDPRPRFALHGLGGSFVKYGVDPQEAALKAGAAPGDPGFGGEASDAFGIVHDGHGTVARLPTLPGCYAAFYDAFAEAILGQGPPPVDPRDARDGLLLIERARESAVEGRRILIGPRPS